MEHPGIAQADIVGYSMGGATGLRLAIDRPELVRKLVAISAHFRLDSIYPEILAGIAEVTPEIMMGTPWYEEYYAPVAPRPEDFPILVEKLKELDATEFDWSQEIDAIAAPTLLIYGDADVIQPEPMVELFRLLGGGVPGDLAGLPRSQLAVLPGTTHVTLVDRADWLGSMIAAFLEVESRES
jgi:pimeloyl-ACP methyl ester carboxylesterase